MHAWTRVCIRYSYTPRLGLGGGWMKGLLALEFPLLLASRSWRLFVVCAAGHEHGCQNAFVDHLPECNHYYFKFRVHAGTGVAV